MHRGQENAFKGANGARAAPFNRSPVRTPSETIKVCFLKTLQGFSNFLRPLSPFRIISKAWQIMQSPRLPANTRTYATQRIYVVTFLVGSCLWFGLRVVSSPENHGSAVRVVSGKLMSFLRQISPI